MKRDYFIWGLLGLFVFVFALSWGFNERREKLAAKKMLDTQYQKAYTEMMDNVENVEVNLGKSIVSASETNNMLIMNDVWRQAFEAQARLNELPVYHPVLERTSVFLAQAGDYCYSLTRAISMGKQLSQEDIDKLEALHAQAGDLSQELHRIFNSAEDGRFTWGELGSTIRQRLPEKDDEFSGSMESIDKKMQEYPTLIYDGPFSDHINKINPRGITGRKIDRDRARDIARDFVDIPSDGIQSVTNEQTVSGEIPVFRVRVTPEDRNKYGIVDVDVSITGGHVIMSTNNREVPDRKVSEEEALNKAADFLEGKGLGTMENTFYMVQNNILVAAFANVQQNVIIYPDQVKVQVALDNGQVIGYEALDYYMTHHKRTIPAPKISMEEARKKVSSRLKVNNARLAVIPGTVGGEVLAYEFQGDIEGDRYYVYINALTGEEEDILKLVKSGEGAQAL